MTQLTVTAAEIKAVGGLEAFTRKVEGRVMLGEGRILAVREGGKAGRKAKPKQPQCPHEDEEQAAVLAWANGHRQQYPALCMLFHVPNGGHRGKAEAGRFKAQGVKAGVPDLCLPVPRGGCHGLWIEMKRRKGGTVSDDQQWWLEELNARGYRAVVCRGSDEAVAELKKYLRGGDGA